MYGLVFRTWTLCLVLTTSLALLIAVSNGPKGQAQIAFRFPFLVYGLCSEPLWQTSR